MRTNRKQWERRRKEILCLIAVIYAKCGENSYLFITDQYV